MTQVDRQTAPKLVYLEVVTTALRKLGLSEESITRGIFQGCGNGSLSYHHTGEAPPSGFWRTSLDNVRFNASDISNMLLCPASTGVMGFYRCTLSDVMLSWEAVVVKYPALRDTEPPELGMSRVEVSFAAPLTRWFETLTTKLGMLVTKLLQRATSAPEAKQDPQKWFDQALKDHPEAPGESDAHYITRLHKLMKVAPVTKVWEKSTVERRFYEGRKAGDKRGSK